MHTLTLAVVDAIEADIAELRGAGAVLDIVNTTTLQHLSPDQAAQFKIPAAVLADYRMYALTPEQAEALDHARLHPWRRYPPA